MAFGLDLLAYRCRTAPTANDVLSPGSAAFALTMLDAGAAGSTRQDIDRLLHLPGWSPQVIAALHDQHQQLATLTQLQVSNRLYTQLGVHPTQQTLDDLATAESADLRTLDFAQHSQQATDVINDQVASDTHRLIRTLFDQPLDAATTTVLTDALYLKAPWRSPFLPAYDAPFHTAGGRGVISRMMNSQEGAAQIRRAGGWTAATLPYTGAQLQAVVLLPPGDSSQDCAAPTPAQLKALTTGASISGPVSMPKLQLTQTSKLTDDLAALGLPLNGNYRGFGGAGPISDVVQKTYLQVDEHGTKAAAATGIGMLSAGMPGVQADRPYLLLIQDTATGTPLFLARINDPTAR